MAVNVQEFGLDCRKCDDKLKQERGCKDKGIVPFYVGEEVYFRCPLKLVTTVSWDYIEAYRFYEKNMLPNGKGWIEECQKYLDAMIIIDNEISSKQKDQINKKKK